jgi:hypothetical protein
MSILGDGLLPGHYPAGEVEPAGRGRRGRFFSRMSTFRFDAEQPSGAVRGKDLGACLQAELAANNIPGTSNTAPRQRGAVV